MTASIVSEVLRRVASSSGWIMSKPSDRPNAMREVFESVVRVMTPTERSINCATRLMGPEPKINTRSPDVSDAWSILFKMQAMGSISTPVSQLILSGSACTKRSSVMKRCAKVPCLLTPAIARPLFFIPLHKCVLAERQGSQLAQYSLGSITTRIPGCRLVTCLPTLMMIPTAS